MYILTSYHIPPKKKERKKEKEKKRNSLSLLCFSVKIRKKYSPVISETELLVCYDRELEKSARKLTLPGTDKQ